MKLHTLCAKNSDWPLLFLFLYWTYSSYSAAVATSFQLAGGSLLYRKNMLLCKILFFPLSWRDIVFFLVYTLHCFRRELPTFRVLSFDHLISSVTRRAYKLAMNCNVSRVWCKTGRANRPSRRPAYPPLVASSVCLSWWSCNQKLPTKTPKLGLCLHLTRGKKRRTRHFLLMFS